jgi:hypothetical protein
MAIQNYQINQFLIGRIVLSGVTVSSTSATITTNLSTACNTAGNGGVAVPFQTSSGITTEGFVVSTINNLTNQCQIFNHSTLAEVLDSNGNQVYGRLTYSGSAYTVSFYSNVNGTETAYSFASTSIDIIVSYVFSLYHLPIDFALVANKYNFDITQVSVPITIRQLLSITTANTVPNLTYTPLNGVHFIYNNIVYTSVDPSPVFAVGGTGNKVVTFTGSNDTPTVQLPSGSSVVAIYEHY